MKHQDKAFPDYIEANLLTIEEAAILSDTSEKNILMAIAEEKIFGFAKPSFTDPYYPIPPMYVFKMLTHGLQTFELGFHDHGTLKSFIGSLNGELYAIDGLRVLKAEVKSLVEPKNIDVQLTREQNNSLKIVCGFKTDTLNCGREALKIIEFLFKIRKEGDEKFVKRSDIYSELDLDDSRSMSHWFRSCRQAFLKYIEKDPSKKFYYRFKITKSKSKK